MSLADVRENIEATIDEAMNSTDPEAVSYTHLDVYKRQIYMKLGDLMSMFSLNANDSQSMGRRIFRRPYLFMRHRACLLYTSMYRQLSSDMQEEYVSLLTVFENLEALYICRNVITVYPDCKSMIDVARQDVYKRQRLYRIYPAL